MPLPCPGCPPPSPVHSPIRKESGAQGLSDFPDWAERHAAAFGGLVLALCQDYLTACDKAGIDPDMALLERVARALGAGGSAADVREEDAGG